MLTTIFIIGLLIIISIFIFSFNYTLKLPIIDYSKGIDIIYWINLDYAKDRREQMEIMLHDPIFSNIPNERINAADGKKDVMKSFQLKTPPTEMTNVEYACLLSHLNTINRFSRTDNEIALILEDDMTLEFKKYWKKTIREIMEDAPPDWEIIQLCYISNEIPYKEYVLNTTQYYSTGAYLIRNSAAKKIIESIYSNDTDKYILEEDISHEADFYLYLKLITYTYNVPYFIYKSNNDSYIHPDHVGPIHDKSKRMVIKDLEYKNRWVNYLNQWVNYLNRWVNYSNQ